MWFIYVLLIIGFIATISPILAQIIAYAIVLCFLLRLFRPRRRSRR